MKLSLGRLSSCSFILHGSMEYKPEVNSKWKFQHFLMMRKMIHVDRIKQLMTSAGPDLKLDCCEASSVLFGCKGQDRNELVILCMKVTFSFDVVRSNTGKWRQLNRKPKLVFQNEQQLASCRCEDILTPPPFGLRSQGKRIKRYCFPISDLHFSSKWGRLVSRQAQEDDAPLSPKQNLRKFPAKTSKKLCSSNIK